MEEVVKTRLKLLIDHVESLSVSAQDTLEKSQLGEVSEQEARLVATKLKASIDRFISEMYNYYKLIDNPSVDDLSRYTSIQIKGEELVAELEVRLRQREKFCDTSIATAGSLNITSKLPKMQLAKFDGDVLKWHTFWDQFSSNVDTRNINDVDKLLYLQSVLEGEAKRAIEGLDTTNKNYAIAVSTLKERYGKPGIIIDAHYAAIYRIKAADNSVLDCRRVFNEIERHLRVLNSLGEDVNHNHLRVMIMQKFSQDLIYELRMKMGTDTDTIENIRKYLGHIISAREASNRMKVEAVALETSGTSKESDDKFTLNSLHVRVDRDKERYNFQRRMRPFSKQREESNRKNTFKEVETRRNFKNDKKNGNFMDRYNRRKRHLEKEDASNTKESEFKRKKVSCIFCGKNHFNDECDVVKSVQDRKRRLEGRCYICFSKGHKASDCKSKMKCRHCSLYGDHNRALCPSQLSTRTDSFHVYTSVGRTILQTAVVRVKKIGSDNISRDCRVLLDCGSQRTYITSKVAKILNLPTLEENRLSVFTFGASHPQEIESPVVNFEIFSKTHHYKVIYANVVPHITNSVPTPNELWKDNRPKNMIMADDGTNGDQVDILIENDYYHSIMFHEKIRISEDLYLVNSDLGWIVSGRFNSAEDKVVDKLSCITYFQSSMGCCPFNVPDPPLQSDNIRRLWDLESIGITDSPKASRDDEAVRQFNETTEYIEGRYHVKWLWIDYPPTLPSNFGLACGRLSNLLKRLDNNVLKTYDNLIKEQLSMGIIEFAPNVLPKYVEHPVHYLPHHCVAQGEKLRIVYDASAKTKGNKSLNECLYRGPLMLEELTGLLLRFREHRVGIVADVEKAFLQVGLQEADRDVTRFLWLKDLEGNVSADNLLHFRFCRVPFGIISSPFLLNATVRYHLMKSEIPIMKQIAEDLYVDNLVTGSESIREGTQLYRVAKKAFDDLSMNLRQWNSNSREFGGTIPSQFLDKETDCIKVLGLQWDLRKDEMRLRFSLEGKDLNQMNTKREVLRLIASVFDPCGFVAPLVLPAKIFLQSLWSQKVHWDTSMKEDALQEWRTILDGLDYIKYITVPRHYETCLVADKDVEVMRELHCFTDASLQAYAAVVYMRSTYKDRNVVSFIIGKSRLVERTEQSNLQIPKLELLGVVIGSRLLRYVMKFLRLNILNQYLWTDSQIVLNWCTSDKLLPPFIAKRVDNIKQNRELRLRYVPTQINPADVATKCSDSRMNDMRRWLTGPDFLTNSIHHWPKNITEVLCSQISSAGEGLPEFPEVQDQNNVPYHEPLDERSGMVDSPLVEANTPGNDTGVTASHKEFSILPEDNFEEILRIQRLYFPKETRGESTDLKRALGLFLDKKGILRCGGRFHHADWPENQKHPVLLPKDDQFTIKVIEKIHVSNYHVGVSHTLSAIRLHYWVPHGRTQVQKVLRRCQACRKQEGGPFKLPPMAQLPPERVRYQKPFSFVGIDYFGPLTVETKGSNEKRWVCLYTCFAVRAIHLEVVQDLTAEQCLLALRRFISTRGTPKMIMSDNALQFKLTSDVLINGYCIEKGIKWKFIPELAPWFGGFYERLIGIVKSCLKRTLEKHILNDTQLCTIMKEVEAVVNSRPLTFVGSEPEHILTPADFLRNSGPLVTEATEEEFIMPATATKASLIEGWKRGQHILQEYIMMFKNHYLTSLRDRKHSHRQPRVVVDTIPKVGDTVQIKGDSNRSLWKVGKICAVIKGSDGQIRVAKVATSPNETLTRSIAHLNPLEISDTEHKLPPVPLRQSDQLPTPPENNRTNTDPQFAQVTVRDTNDSTTSGGDASPSRPRRLAAQKARDKVKEWTSQLLYNVHCIPNDDIVI